MATLHTNESRQLYVVSTVAADPTTITSASAAGTTAITGVTTAASPFGQAYGYITTKGIDTIERSDIIKEENIVNIKHTPAAKMRKPMRKLEITLDPTVNGGNPIAGQTYELNIVFREWIGVSPENQYFKFGVVHATTGMTAAQFYLKMLDSLNLNFKREPLKVLNFTVDNPTTPTKLVIEEVIQPWRLGIGQANTDQVNFSVYTDNVLLNGDFFTWGIVTEVAPSTFEPNGHAIADMEYFYHGERGDIYRNVGWPNVWFTQYMVNPEDTYDVYDILFNFEGENQESYYTRKLITLVVPVAQTDAVATALQAAFPDVPYVEAVTPAP